MPKSSGQPLDPLGTLQNFANLIYVSLRRDWTATKQTHRLVRSPWGKQSLRKGPEQILQSFGKRWKNNNPLIPFMVNLLSHGRNQLDPRRLKFCWQVL